MKISNIKKGDRIRQDLGDIQKLAQNIEEVGLIHPIVLDENINKLRNVCEIK